MYYESDGNLDTMNALLEQHEKGSSAEVTVVMRPLIVTFSFPIHLAQGRSEASRWAEYLKSEFDQENPGNISADCRSFFIEGTSGVKRFVCTSADANARKLVPEFQTCE